jgi:hypothetical protein
MESGGLQTEDPSFAAFFMMIGVGGRAKRGRCRGSRRRDFSRGENLKTSVTRYSVLGADPLHGTSGDDENRHAARLDSSDSVYQGLAAPFP